MAKYDYKARDGMGKAVRGAMEASSKEELAGKLQKMGYMPTQMSEALPEINLAPALDKFFRVPAEALILFNIQLSNMVNAGMTLRTSLGILSRQAENRRLKEAIGDVTRNLEAGESFSEALAHHPRIFSKLFVSMAKAGEASGKLDQILSRFAAFTDEQEALKQKINGALFYPLILLAAGIAVTLFIVTFVIPQFVQIFVKVGIPLPLPTLILYQIGIGIQQFWLSLLLIFAACWMGFQYYGGTRLGILQWDQCKLKIPVIGGLIRKACISRFANTLAMLVESGVPILVSLGIVSEVIGNEVLRRVIEQVKSVVEKGEKIADPLGTSGEFPMDAVQMITVGEETGKLAEMLEKISSFYDRAVGYALKKLTTLVEPLLLVIMGGLVGFIMASMLLPMFDMMKVLRH